MHGYDWDDLRILAAIRDHGTFAGAARSLAIDETTIGRRVSKLQSALKIKLFDAIDGARVPTHTCAQILAHIDQMTKHAMAIDRLRLAKGPDQPRIKLRLATTNGLAEELLAPRLGILLRRLPHLTVQLVTSSSNLNFSRWEADIAVRLKKPERGNFATARLADIPLFLVEPGGQSDGDTARIACAYPRELDDTPEMAALMKRGLHSNARLITTSARVIRRMIEDGHAAGVLPGYLCADLVGRKSLRVTPLTATRPVWLLLQEHLKRDTAARAVVTWIKECLVPDIPSHDPP